MPNKVKRDWLSPRESEFADLCEQWNIHLRNPEKIAQFHWDEDEIGEVLVAIKAFLTARAAFLADDSSANRSLKNVSMKRAKAAMRSFANTSIRFNRFMRESDKEVFGVVAKDNTYTPVSTPTSRAIIDSIKALGGFRVEIRFHDELTPTRKSIPYGYNGCLLNFVYLDERVTDFKALNHSALMTKSTYVLRLEPDSERKYLSCAARWQNDRGELGPWSDIGHVVIA